MSPSPATAFIFPGQGSQKLGMGRAWAERRPEAAQAFEEANDVLGFDLGALCWDGPEDELQLTANLQPALVATSVAILRGLRAERPDLVPVAVAGHSLGEYSAHVAAGSLAFDEALRLVRRRGELMQEAVPVGEGAMAAILALDDDTVRGLVEEVARGQVLAVANYNAPGQVVVAGHQAAVERAVEAAREMRGKPRMLAVSAPFHCALMAPAREGLEPALAAAPFADPQIPVVTNIDAEATSDGDAGRTALVRQVDGPVRWVESVERMTDSLGVERFVEVGPGSVLINTIKRIRPDTERFAVAEPEALDGLA
jgi:[acyl-carrier-protein] S-malonyltransferase